MITGSPLALLKSGQYPAINDWGDDEKLANTSMLSVFVYHTGR